MKYLLNIVWILLLAMSCGGPSKPELHVFIWSDYVKPELIERFEKEHDCRVILDTYDSNESMYAKLKLGAKGYDIILPSNYYLDLMQQQNMLHPLDTSKIPNLKYIDPVYLKVIGISSFDNGVPYMVTNTGIAYRKDKVENFNPSWDVFARTDLKGRMTMLNDLREALGAALKFLGYSLNTIDASQIDKATQQLIAWKNNLAKFESEQYKNGIASAEYLVVQGYSGDIVQVMQENPNITFAYPEQGSMISADYLVIPKDAMQRELAHAFINFLLEPDVAAENIGFTFYLCPNVGAYEKLSPALRNNVALFPPESMLNKSEVIKDLGESITLYTKAWDTVKAAD